eukprot:CAMPEP_0119379834 /NCGR_PEP_ID=MMETSP1334-20130426/54277_1 /TAXON_ID=127549 /ORGANISM="Calcidiscus leptoporus, Strain RCC1130" /LENGTH=281 /DNA_ID=CAMNT_0007399457 /DNA_START=45 /DNA_END=890 /DNA_ORIENTATION=+
MPRERIEPLLCMLHDCAEECGEGLRFAAPPLTDHHFWRAAAIRVCGVEDDVDAEVEGQKLAISVHAELESASSYVQVTPDLALGDLPTSGSRLMLLAHGVKGLCYISSHEMDALWSGDGLVYHHLKISPGYASCQSTLVQQLHEACTFLCASHRPAVVVSSCPKLRALVLAALMILEGQHRCVRCSRAQTSIAACLGKLEACGVHTEQLGTTEMHVLQTFAVGLNEALTHKPPPRHGGLEVGTPTGGTRAQTGAPTTPGSKRSAQREPVDARKKLMPELRL